MGGSEPPANKRPPHPPLSPRAQFAVGALVALSLLLPVWWQASVWYEARLLREKRTSASDTLASHAEALTAALSRQITVLHGLRAFMQHELTGPQPDPRLGADFSNFATILCGGAEQGGLLAVAGAPEGIIRYVSPATRRTSLVGYDLLQDSDTPLRTDVQLAITSRQIVVGGPYALGLGDKVLVAQQALYASPAPQAGEDYWGIVTVFIDLEKLLAEAGLTTELSVLDLAIRDEQRHVVFGSPAVFSRDPVMATSTVPGINWELAAVPFAGWVDTSEAPLLAFRAATMIPLFLAAALAGTVFGRQVQLSWTVRERTKELADANARLVQDIEEHRRTAAALRESEQRFRSAFEHAAFGMALVGTDGMFLQVNPSLSSMFGYSEAELTRRTFSELTYAEDLDTGVELFQDLMAGRKDFGWLEKRYIHKSGGTIWTQLSTAAVRDHEGHVLYLVSQIQDITERKEAVASLAEKEQQYRGIFEATGDGLLITSLDGTIVAINPAACAMYGYARDELVGSAITLLIQPERHGRFVDMLERVRAGHEFVIQATDLRKDGTEFYVEIHGSAIVYAGQPHLLSVVRDITDRIRSMQLLEQRVQERTRELSTLLQVSRDVVSTLRLEPLLTQILDRLRDVVSYDAAAIFALDDDGTLTLLDYRGPRLKSDLPRHWDLGEAEHIRMVLDRRQPLAIPDVHAGTLQAQVWQQSWGAPLGRMADNSASWLGVPLMAKDRVIGSLTLEHTEVDHFSPLHARLALAFANQVAVAIENARLYEASQRLGMLEERQRIARELHDSVSQALYGIGLGARTARALLDRDPPEAVAPIEYILSLAEAGLSEMRALIFELRPDSLIEGTLGSGLAKQIAALQKHHGLDIATDFGAEPALPAEIKEALYRVAHEALNNTVKHAAAKHVRVSLRHTADTIRLRIEDDGIGFDPDGPFPGHYGLQSMRERIDQLGGQLLIDSVPGQGTRLEAAIRLRKQP